MATALRPPDPSSTSDSILDAAEELFAARGFDAVPIKDIAKRAGVNVALIYYYHDSKQTLYKHVIERFVRELVKRATARLNVSHDPESAIRGVAAAQFEMLSAKPHFPRLIVRELIDYHAEHAVGALRELGAHIFKRLCDIIADGQARGVFRREVDPRFAAFSTIAQLPYFFVARPALGAISAATGQPLDEKTAAAFAQHAGDFAVAALRATPTP
jgi:TetR/AcrR family transcriptional regulator